MAVVVGARGGADLAVAAGAGARDPEGEAGEEEREGHEGEGGEEEVASAERVDGVDGGDGEEEVDDAEAEGGGQRGLVAEAAVFEDAAAVVGDYVDAAELGVGVSGGTRAWFAIDD